MFSTPMKSAGENVKDELITQNTLIGDIAQSLGLTVTEASGSNTKAQLEAFNQNLQLIKNGSNDFLPENIKSGVTMWGKTGTFDNSNGQYIWKKCNEYEFIDYVVSDNENKYPDGAIHTDGYYYERTAGVTLDGAIIKNELTLVTENSNYDAKLSVLPYDFYNGSAVVYDGKIHILGGTDNGTKHYEYNNGSWTEVSVLPYDFYNGSAVVYDGKIHILGGIDNRTKHYAFDGSSWTSVSTLPYSFYYGSAVVYNNEIHIMSGESGPTTHYKWNGSSWTSDISLHSSAILGSAVVYNGKIHIMGSSYNEYSCYHYAFDGSSWTSVSTLPYQFYSGLAVVYDGKIHILGSKYSSTYSLYHYAFDGNSWSGLRKTPYGPMNGGVAILKDKICLLGGGHPDQYILDIKIYREVF